MVLQPHRPPGGAAPASALQGAALSAVDGAAELPPVRCTPALDSIKTMVARLMHVAMGSLLGNVSDEAQVGDAVEIIASVFTLCGSPKVNGQAGALLALQMLRKALALTSEHNELDSISKNIRNG